MSAQPPPVVPSKMIVLFLVLATAAATATDDSRHRPRALLNARRTLTNVCSCNVNEYWKQSSKTCKTCVGIAAKRKQSCTSSKRICENKYNARWDAVRKTAGQCTSGCYSCKPGYVCVGGMAKFCSAGTYALPTATDCIACAPGTYTTGIYAAVSVADCIPCPATYACPGGTDRVACSPGKYADKEGISSCKECEPGYACSGVERQKCEVGRYAKESGTILYANSFYQPCTLCPSGKYANEEASTVCKDCALGSYIQNSKTHGFPSQCLPCEMGKYSSSGTDGFPQCTDCDKGKYSDALSSSICKEDCTVGQYANVFKCEPCGTGKFFVAEVTPRDILACKVCANGQYNDETGKSECKSDCPPGHHIVWWKGACVKCSVGTAASENNTWGASGFCPSCPVGQYQNEKGKTSCKSDCPEGFGVSPDKSTCSQCNPGTYDDGAAANLCVSCSSPTYQNERGKTSCKSDCPLGNHVREHRYCVPCGQGFYGKDDGTCKMCPTGFWNGDEGQHECMNCMAGNHITGVQGVPTRCVQCEAGEYQNEDGRTLCEQCVSGMYQHEQGQRSCVSCPDGFYRGYYDPKVSCKECAPGTFSFGTGAPWCGGCYQATIVHAHCAECNSADFGECTLLECETTWIDVNGDKQDGCECNSQQMETVAHGNCTACDSRDVYKVPGGSGPCTEVTCDDEHANGDQDASNGCEAVRELHEIRHSVKLRNLSPVAFNVDPDVVKSFVETASFVLGVKADQVHRVRACGVGSGTPALCPPLDSYGYAANAEEGGGARRRRRLAADANDCVVLYIVRVESAEETILVENKMKKERRSYFWTFKFRSRLGANDVKEEFRRSVVAEPSDTVELVRIYVETLPPGSFDC